MYKKNPKNAQNNQKYSKIIKNIPKYSKNIPKNSKLIQNIQLQNPKNKKSKEYKEVVPNNAK
jgi:hypothetical protein